MRADRREPLPTPLILRSAWSPTARCEAAIVPLLTLSARRPPPAGMTFEANSAPASDPRSRVHGPGLGRCDRGLPRRSSPSRAGERGSHWAVPAILAGAGGVAAEPVGPGGIELAILAAAARIIATVTWWERADQTG